MGTTFMTRKTSVVIALLGCITTTCASSLHVENALLRNQLAERDIEIARLTAENTALRAQVGAEESADDMLENTGTKTANCPVFQWDSRKKEAGTFGGGFAGDRCRGRCDLVHNVVNKDCVVSKHRMEASMASVVLDTGAPSNIIRWRVYQKTSWKTQNAKKPGSVGFDLVSCPCNKKHELTEYEALRHILGQTAAMKPY